MVSPISSTSIDNPRERFGYVAIPESPIGSDGISNVGFIKSATAPVPSLSSGTAPSFARLPTDVSTDIIYQFLDLKGLLNVERVDRNARAAIRARNDDKTAGAWEQRVSREKQKELAKLCDLFRQPPKNILLRIETANTWFKNGEDRRQATSLRTKAECTRRTWVEIQSKREAIVSELIKRKTEHWKGTVGVFGLEGFEIQRSNLIVEVARMTRENPWPSLKGDDLGSSHGDTIDRLQARGFSDPQITAVASGRSLEEVFELTPDQAYALYLLPGLEREQVIGANSWFSRYDANLLASGKGTYSELYQQHLAPSVRTRMARWASECFADVWDQASLTSWFVYDCFNVQLGLYGFVSRVSDDEGWELAGQVVGVVSAIPAVVLGGALILSATAAKLVFSTIGGMPTIFGLLQEGARSKMFQWILSFVFEFCMLVTKIIYNILRLIGSLLSLVVVLCAGVIFGFPIWLVYSLLSELGKTFCCC